MPNRAAQGPWYYAAAVSAGSTDVELVLSAAGFSQRFSLMTLTRPGPDPVVLYRDVDNPAIVVADSSAVGVGATTGPPDSGSYRLMIGAATTTIGWFAPDASLRTPASTDRAFLTVRLDVKPSLDNNNDLAVHLNLPAAVPAGHVHLVLGDGSRLDATHTGADDNSFSGVYYFTVPASLSAGTVSVDSYSAPGEIIVGGVVHGEITFNSFTILLALPAAPVASPATTPPTVLKLTHANAASSPSATSGPGSGPGGLNPIVPLVVVAAVGAGLAVATRRRRRIAGPVAAPYTTGGVPTAPSPPSVDRDWTVAAPTPWPPPATVPARRQPPTAEPSSAQPPTAAVPAVVPPPVLTPIPTVAVTRAEGALCIEVLGSSRIAGWPEDQSRSVPVMDLATFLALHPERPYTHMRLNAPTQCSP